MVPALLPLGLLGSQDVPEPPSYHPVHVWIDAPLPGTVLASADQCRIIAHGSSAAGIASFEVTIDDETPTDVTSPDTVASLVTLTLDCEISEPGRHLVRLRALDNDGTASTHALTNVLVPTDDAPTEPEAEPVDSTTTVPDTTTTLPPPTTTPGSTTTAPPSPPTTTAPPPPPTATTPPTTTPPTTSPPPPPTTPQTTAADTRPPSISVTHAPAGTSLPEFTLTTFTATAGDNVGVARIEIIIRGDIGRGGVVRTCDGTNVCEYIDGYPPGNIHYSARAFDTSGNEAITVETTINYFVVVR